MRRFLQHVLPKGLHKIGSRENLVQGRISFQPDSPVSASFLPIGTTA